MLIIPAIDIQGGAVVRFFQGRLEKKVYSRDPVKTARHWLRQGAQLIHVVDLDGAISGKPKNIETVRRIVRETDAPIQFGGGVRSVELIRQLLDCGVKRLVLGTKAIEDPGFLKKAFKIFKDKVIVSVDSRFGKALSRGWQNSRCSKDALKLCLSLKKLGFKELIYTDILKDGSLKGPNIKDLKNLLKETRMKIISSGGISSLDDIRKLKSLEKDGVSGVIIGKALYEARFTLAEALEFA